MYRAWICAFLAFSCGGDAARTDALLPDGAGLQDGAAIDAPVPDALIADAGDPVEVADAGEPVEVADPGTEPMPVFPALWMDTEPNDTPAQAVPMGVATDAQGTVIAPYIDPGHLGGADPADYFVFRTNDTALRFQMVSCWTTSGINLLDFTLYKIIDGQPLVTVASYTSTSPSVEPPGVVPSVAIEANAKYLLAIINIEGESDYRA